MYNGLIINKLLESRQIKIVEFQEALGISYNGYKSIVNGNPTVNTLERVADFFEISIAEFFDRNFSSSNTVGNISSSGNNIQNGHNGHIN